MFITNVNAQTNFNKMWEFTEMPLYDNDATIKFDLFTVNDSYYSFAEFINNEKKYLEIVKINRENKNVKTLRIETSSYEYKVTKNEIIIVNILNNTTDRKIVLSKYDLNLNLDKQKENEYIEERELVDSEILITDNSILVAFSLKDNSGNENALIHKYNYNFELIDSLDKMVNPTGMSTNDQRILKNSNSLVFSNRTYHYVQYCYNAAKINENFEIIEAYYCIYAQSTKLLGTHCTDDKCNFHYKSSNRNTHSFFSYDVDTHNFHEIGEYSLEEKNAELILQTYKYHSLNAKCEGDYCEIKKIDDDFNLLIEYEKEIKKNIKIFNKDEIIIYENTYEKINNVLSTSNDTKIALAVNSNDDSKLIVIDKETNNNTEINIDNIKYICYTNNILTINNQTNNKNNILEYVELIEPQIIGSQNGNLKHEIVLVNNEYKLKITITPKKDYYLKEVKVTDDKGNISIYNNLNFILDNKSYTIEPVFIKIENPITIDKKTIWCVILIYIVITHVVRKYIAKNKVTRYI